MSHLVRRPPQSVQSRTDDAVLVESTRRWLAKSVAVPIVTTMITVGGVIGAAAIADNASCEPQIKTTRTTTQRTNGQTETTTTEERIRCPE